MAPPRPTCWRLSCNFCCGRASASWGRFPALPSTRRRGAGFQPAINKADWKSAPRRNAAHVSFHNSNYGNPPAADGEGRQKNAPLVRRPGSVYDDLRRVECHAHVCGGHGVRGNRAAAQVWPAASASLTFDVRLFLGRLCRPWPCGSIFVPLAPAALPCLKKLNVCWSSLRRFSTN
jgi:hypothetical protein